MKTTKSNAFLYRLSNLAHVCVMLILTILSHAYHFRWLFLTEDDIKNLPCFQVCLSPLLLIAVTNLMENFILMMLWFLLTWQNQTLIAIKAPHGTTLEVPDPDEVGWFWNLPRVMNAFILFLMYLIWAELLLCAPGCWLCTEKIQDSS